MWHLVRNERESTMKISARVRNTGNQHEATVTTNAVDRTVPIPPRESGPGSGVNGGELLFLALATCYCNDFYREAALVCMDVQEVEVDVHGDFGDPGEPPIYLRYHVRVVADAPERDIRSLVLHTDTVAEIQNTMRSATLVRLGHVETASL
jgi:uncharacterized OsmC-like protein